MAWTLPANTHVDDERITTATSDDDDGGRICLDDMRARRHLHRRYDGQWREQLP
jgi:hypothetical protein